MRIEGVNLENFRSLLFYLLEAQKLELRKDQVMEDQVSPAYTLLLIAAGDCSLYADDKLIPAPEQSCYIVPPDQSWYIANYSGETALLYRLAFKIVSADTVTGYGKPLSRIHYNWRLFPYPRGAKLVEQLTADTDSGMDWFRRQQMFMELIGILLEHNAGGGDGDGSLSSAEQSVRFMEEHYRLPLNMKQLAEQAGTSP